MKNKDTKKREFRRKFKKIFVNKPTASRVNESWKESATPFMVLKFIEEENEK